MARRTVTIEVPDEETGKVTRYLAWTSGRSDRIHLAELPDLSTENAPPRRLLQRARFAEAATRAYGEKMLGPLPPAAMAVRDGATGRIREAPARNKRALRQEELRHRIGPERLAFAADLLGIQRLTESGISVRIPPHMAEGFRSLALPEMKQRPLRAYRLLTPEGVVSPSSGKGRV